MFYAVQRNSIAFRRIACASDFFCLERSTKISRRYYCRIRVFNSPAFLAAVLRRILCPRSSFILPYLCTCFSVLSEVLLMQCDSFLGFFVTLSELGCSFRWGFVFFCYCRSLQCFMFWLVFAWHDQSLKRPTKHIQRVVSCVSSREKTHM